MKRCSCGNEIEEIRAAWADTCQACSARGCGATWRFGAPVKRCDGCDCMPPDEDLKRGLNLDEMHQRRGLGGLYYGGRKIGELREISISNPLEPRIRGTLKIRA